MADPTIKPVLPINRSSDALKKNKSGEEKKEPSKPQKPEQKKEKKGIIDTYA